MINEPQRLSLRYAEAVACELVAVVRNHHDSMVGVERDRPGWDRVLLRLPDGSEIIADVWSQGAQDFAAAPDVIEVYDAGETVRWRLPSATPPVVEPANDAVEGWRLVG